MGFLYLAALTVALTGMVMLDRRFRLFFWRNPSRAAIVLGVGRGISLASVSESSFEERRHS
jgi:hypothetical protein